MSGRRRLAFLALCAFLGSAPAESQHRDSLTAGVAFTRSDRTERVDAGAAMLGLALPAQPAVLRSGSRGGVWDHGAKQHPWWAPALSAALPGAGQVALGQPRFVPYMVAEAYFWLRYTSHRSEARRERRAYQTLAARVARSRFSDTLPTGDWEYYERMENFVESGVYDRSLGSAFEPETDESTYNGSVWLLARGTFWENPDSAPDRNSFAYRKAISFYKDRAVEDQYRWSWRNAQLEQDVFRRTIARSNRAFQQSVQDLGLIIANHVLGTVDSYVTVRIRRRELAGTSSLGVSATVPWAPFGRPSAERPAGARRSAQPRTQP